MVLDCFSYTSVGGRDENQDSIIAIGGKSDGLFVVEEGHKVDEVVRAIRRSPLQRRRPARPRFAAVR